MRSLLRKILLPQPVLNWHRVLELQPRLLSIVGPPTYEQALIELMESTGATTDEVMESLWSLERLGLVVTDTHGRFWRTEDVP